MSNLCLPILTYHALAEGVSPVSISQGLFRWQLRYLKQHGYQAVGLEEMLNYSAGESAKPQRKIVALTFDDGVHSVYQTAFPLLRKLGWTATVFLATGYLGRHTDWPLDPGVPRLPMLNWRQVEEMDRAGINFQPHSVTHPKLTDLNRSQLEQELRDSREEIERRLGKPARIFCYPHGDYNARVINCLQQLGYQGALTTRLGCCRSGSPPFELPRIGSARLRSGFRMVLALGGKYAQALKIKQALIGK